MRYLSTQDMLYYLPIVDDKYQIKIYRNLTFGKAVEDAALTPLSIVADSLVILEHLIILPTQD